MTRIQVVSVPSSSLKNASCGVSILTGAFLRTRQVQSATRTETLFATWGWLFPLTYLLHLAEEWWGGEGFPVWINRIAGVEMTAGQFLVWNNLALFCLTMGVFLAMRIKSLRWLPLAFGVAFLLNALSHLAASLLTVSYSPGLVSGLLLWTPLGTVTLLRTRKSLSRRAFRAGLIIGGATHAIVLVLTLLSGQLAT